MTTPPQMERVAIASVPSAMPAKIAPVDSATCARVDVLDGSLSIFEVRVLEQSHQFAVIARVDLTVDQQRHAFFEAQCGHAGLGQLFLQTCCQAIQFQGAQLRQGGVHHHRHVLYHLYCLYCLLVIAGAAQMDVFRADPFVGNGRDALVAVVLQDVVHMAVLAGADLQGQHASRFEAHLAIALSQR